MRVHYLRVILRSASANSHNCSINNGDELWLKQTGISADVNLSLTRAALTIVCSFQTSFFPALPSLRVETKPFLSLFVCFGDETRQHETR
jgi:hypothetical protein